MDDIFRKHADLKNIFVTTSKAFEIAAYLKRRKIKGVHVIGFDILQENIQYLGNGFIHFLINQHPEGQGYWGVYLLTDHLVFKKDVPEIKYLPLDIVSKENVSYYISDEKRLSLNR